MDDNKVYAIVCSNMRIVEEGATPFNDEAAVTPILRDDSIELRGSHVDPSPSVNSSYLYDRDTLAADMARLRSEGIEVDTEQPAPENITNEPLLSTTRILAHFQDVLIQISKTRRVVGNASLGRRLQIWMCLPSFACACPKVIPGRSASLPPICTS
jgi:hypothetical protein